MGEILKTILRGVWHEMRDKPYTMILLLSLTLSVAGLHLLKADAADVESIKGSTRAAVSENINLNSKVDRNQHLDKIEQYQYEIRMLELRKGELEIEGKPISPLYDTKITELKHFITAEERKLVKIDQDRQERLAQRLRQWSIEDGLTPPAPH